ncbi:unnamed protein product [Mycena citricolor]|uniref:Uncharacterized protein n=1 Tax=Mycena citricolor TaxID=2018698 RepID=A0AAD2H5S9_9AGAR|nr:unnamed protein product [Mycena citricolor]
MSASSPYPKLDSPASLLDVFVNAARDPHTAARRVLECGADIWTYAALDAVSDGIARELAPFGLAPKVAVVSENHPFVFALLFAVWKLGGTFIPIDAHVPFAMLTGMMNIVKPTCLYLPASATSNISLAKAFDTRIVVFGHKENSMQALFDKYSLHAAPLHAAPLHYAPPSADHACLYLFTSSASSTKNLKAVPLTHTLVLRGCQSKLAWWRRVQPGKNLDAIRILGWAPWSHVLAYMQARPLDIGTATLLNAGCYVFATIPSSYPQLPTTTPVDLTTSIIDALVTRRVAAFACVPFVLANLKAACQSSHPARALLLEALQKTIMLECGGAALDDATVDWAERNDIRIFTGIGMTETGGAVFVGLASESRRGFLPEGLLGDASFSISSDTDVPDEGELVVKSKLIAPGYVGYDDGAHSVDSDGWVTFRTGDRYRQTQPDGRFTWLGRITDFIQMVSGEYLDPRPLEESLRASPLIANACIVGDAFLSSASTSILAIIELAAPDLAHTASIRAQLARVLAPLNRDLPPPLRIAASSILVLDGMRKIPKTKKGDIFRKKLEDTFGAEFEQMLRPEKVGLGDLADVDAAVVRIVGNLLGISDEELLSTLSFAELGMTSLLAVKIASELNKFLDGRAVLPTNICYIHFDVPSLTSSVRERLSSAPSSITSAASDPAASSPGTPRTDEIVIVGKAFRLPDGVNDDAALWDVLTGESASIIKDIPADRWDHASFYPKDIHFGRAGLVDVARFDYGFFGMTASEAYSLSPTMRLALEVAYEALEDANIPFRAVKGSRMGVFVAVKDDGFETLLHAGQGYDAYTRFYGTGRAPSTASGRINYLLDLHGPSITVDTACSGGIVCIDQAVTYLQSGAAETAIVCSSNTHCWPGSFMFLTAQGMASPNGRCASFTSDADGYAPSEGAVGFVLKTRSAAVRDGDRILATIRATEIGHNGRSQGLAAPNVRSQAAAHRAVLRRARLDPSEIDFIEAHGTGTTLGDLCEVQGINDSFVSSKKRANPLVVSASKSTIGHTEPSAGLVGILSALMSFERRIVPRLAYLTEDNVNPALDASVVPLHFPTKHIELRADVPCKAVVMSYGFAGTLADIVLESEVPQPTPAVAQDTAGQQPMLFVLSAKTPRALAAYIELYLAFLRHADPALFPRICYTACVAREHYKHRVACVAADIVDLIAQLETRLAQAGGGAASGAGGSRPARTGPLVFAFSGQGTQFPAMAAQLARGYARFGELVGGCARMARELSGFPVDDILLGHDEMPPVKEEGAAGEVHSEVDQICIFVYQYAMCRWLSELGVEPKAVVGHSLGEITAAAIAGALPFETALDLVVTRARLLKPCASQPSGMAALACTPAVASKLTLGASVSVSVYNGPQSICLSGASAELDDAVRAAKARNIKATRLQVDQGFHSPCVDAAVPGLRAWCAANRASFAPLKMPLYSTVRGDVLPKGATLDPEHWVAHARNPVLFAQTAARMQQDAAGIRAVVDVGPQAVAWSLLLLNGLSATRTLAVGAKKGADQEHALLGALGALYEQHKVTPDFARLYAQRPGAATLEKTRIPTYPFERTRCYPTFIPSRFAHGAAPAAKTNGEILPAEEEENADPVAEAVGSLTKEDLRAALVACLRATLELRPDEELDESEPLTVHGVDSIGFAKLRKQVEDRWGLDIPVVYWSDAFSVGEMLSNLVDQYDVVSTAA